MHLSYTLLLQISPSLTNLPAIPLILTLMMDVTSPLNTTTPRVTTSLIPCLSLLFITPSLRLTSIKVELIIPPTPMAGRHGWTTNLLLFLPPLDILRLRLVHRPWWNTFLIVRMKKKHRLVRLMVSPLPVVPRYALLNIFWGLTQRQSVSAPGLGFRPALVTKP